MRVETIAEIKQEIGEVILKFSDICDIEIEVVDEWSEFCVEISSNTKKIRVGKWNFVREGKLIRTIHILHELGHINSANNIKKSDGQEEFEANMWVKEKLFSNKSKHLQLIRTFIAYLDTFRFYGKDGTSSQAAEILEILNSELLPNEKIKFNFDKIRTQIN